MGSLSERLHPESERLSEFVDGGLAPREQAEIETHLEACDDCREVVDDLRLLVARASALEDLEPAADLWPGIAHRLEERPARWFGWTRTWGSRVAFTVPQLAAAAAVLVFLSGGSVWLLMRGAPGPAPAGTPNGSVAVNRSAVPSAEPSPSSAGPSTTSPRPSETASRAPESGAASGESGMALAGYDLVRYDATIAELQRVLTDNHADLDSSTVRIIQQNLDIIDHAIGDARRALLADPANPYLNGHLAQQLQRKVRLLQQATDMVAAHQS